MCNDNSIYKTNQFVRVPLAIKELRGIEKDFRTQLASELNNQTNRVLTEQFVGTLVTRYESIKRSVKKTEPDELLLEMMIQEELLNHSEFSDTSDSNVALKALIALMLLKVILTGLIVDKKILIAQLKQIDDQRVRDIIARIEIKNLKITNKEIINFIDLYSSNLVRDLGVTSIARMQVFLRNAILRGRTVEQITNDISKLYGINKRRAATIARTEIMNAKALETREFLRRRGIGFWQWLCNRPEDIGCLINCGVIRKVGDIFPSGHKHPTVHPNCQCYMRGYVPQDGYALELFILALLAGYDWLGD